MIKGRSFMVIATMMTLLNSTTTANHPSIPRDVNKPSIEEKETDTVKSADNIEDIETGIIFIGDSRTVGMGKAVQNEDNVYFIAKVGEGYSWMVNTAIPEVDEVINENNDIDKWIIVSNYGVNDLRNIDKYVDKYNELENNEWSDYNLYIMSVNPVDENKCHSVSNDNIDKFNNKIKENSFNYIDTNNITSEIMQTQDGLHYDNSTYISIYDYTMRCLEEYGEYSTKTADANTEI